ncbi:MAG: hypothetical protein JSU86_13275 [Phycisphaerales bacterium]|nr:MAG: hypothetical protein JSU86_13275 [Phycisphaerales bacterium]
MFRFNRLVCVLLVGTCVGVAFAAAVKIKAFTPEGVNGLAENPYCDGMAVLNHHPGNNATEVQVAVTDFLPDTVYGVMLEAGGFCGGFSNPEAFMTNANGNGHYHHSVPYDCSQAPVITIYRWDGDVNSIWDVSEDEIRAVGSSN